MAIKFSTNGSDIGFGTKEFDVERLVNKDGTFNVKKRGLRLRDFSLFYYLINLGWTKFGILITISYLVVNAGFASIYYWIGVDSLSAFQGTTNLDAFLHCFFFSAQTMTTVGYGVISPVTATASFIAAFEAMVGLIVFAFATGIFYGRFSKAKARIRFSENAVVSPYRGITGLKFRIMNLRKNHLIDMEARFIYSYLEMDKSEVKRRYSTLNLEISSISLFAVPWTIVHPIDEKSPIYGKKTSDLATEKAEFLVILKGYDETFNQYVHQVYDYKFDEVLFDSDFNPMFDASTHGVTEVFVDKIDSVKNI